MALASAARMIVCKLPVAGLKKIKRTEACGMRPVGDERYEYEKHGGTTVRPKASLIKKTRS